MPERNTHQYETYYRGRNQRYFFPLPAGGAGTVRRFSGWPGGGGGDQQRTAR